MENLDKSISPENPHQVVMFPIYQEIAKGYDGPDSIKKFLAKSNVEGDFLENEDKEKFEALRKKLNSEAGIIISNHPGYFDSLLILSQLERNDLKIVASEKTYNFLSTNFDPNLLIRVERTPEGIIHLLSDIKKHVAHGGLVLFYPTGGPDDVIKGDGVFSFASGFSAILKNLKPEDMVYLFNINPEDMKAVATEIFENNRANPSEPQTSFKEKKIIRVDEAYTQAKDWPKVDKDPNPNKTLSDLYLSHFSRE